MSYMNNMKLNLSMPAYCLIYIFHVSTSHLSVIALDNLHYCEAQPWLGRGC